MQFQFHPYLFNPLYWILKWAIHQENIRYIKIYGGSSAAKTYTITQVLTYEAVTKGSSSMVLRKFGVDIEDSVYADFKEVGQLLKYNEVETFIKRLIRVDNGAIIRFRGLDESEKLKGLKGFRYLYYNELSLFDEADFDQGRKRLRGMKGQKIISDWNPIIQTHWIKTNIIDKDTWTNVELTKEMIGAPTKYCMLDPEHSFVKINSTGNTLLIKTTYKDNYWVVGHPSGKGGFHDKHVIADFESDKIKKPNDYRIYGLGEWGLIRTGSEFWKSFDESLHTRPLPPYQQGTIHVSLDNNVHPYVTVSIWQIDAQKKIIQQIHELPCESPDNTAKKAAIKFVAWLNKVNCQDMVYIYGDPSANARSTVDDDGRSFFDKFRAHLKESGIKYIDRVQKSAPEVAMSGSFINDIYAGEFDWTITINTSCRYSIDDYCMTKEDQEGKVLKKREQDKTAGISYEKYGHFTDAKRYFITTVLKSEFEAYKSRHKKRRMVEV